MSKNNQSEKTTLLSSREVMQILGVGRTTLWSMCKTGRFPRPLELSRTNIRWRNDEVMNWIDNQPRVE